MDALFADQHGLRLGDRLPMLGTRCGSVGLTDGTRHVHDPTGLHHHAPDDRMLRATGTTGAVLVEHHPPRRGRRPACGRGLTRADPGELHQASLRLATEIYGSPGAG